jgi:hypothetical protein
VAQTLIEYLGESNLYAIDFSANLSLVSPGELLSTVVSVDSDPAAGLSISEQSVESAGKRVLFRIIPSATGSYEIRCTTTTTQGNTKMGKGTLLVREL